MCTGTECSFFFSADFCLFILWEKLMKLSDRPSHQKMCVRVDLGHRHVFVAVGGG